MGNTAEEILLVIDMQPEFEAAFDTVLQSAIIEEINSAINNDSIVIFIEYVGSSSTLSNLTAVTSNYNQTYFLKKNTDSAYNAAKSLFMTINLISIKKLKICGINTDACVYDTVKDFFMQQLRRDYMLNKQIAIDYVTNRKAVKKNCQPRALKHVQSFDVENIEVLSHACGADFDAHDGALRKIRRIGYNTLVICNK